MSISGFPDVIRVTFGSAWQSIFSEDETLVLQKYFSDSYNITYSEDGTNISSATNRIRLIIYNDLDTALGMQFSNWVVSIYPAWLSIAAFRDFAQAGTIYQFKERWSNNDLISITNTGITYPIQKTSGNKTVIQSIFKNIETWDLTGHVAGGEINVKTWGDYTVVLDGSTTPVYLGESRRLQTGKIKKMIIENLHYTQPLYVSDITVSGNFRIMESLSDIAGYDVTSEDVIIPALGYTTFRIQQLTQDFGHHQGTVTITSGDVDEGEYTFLVSGDVTTGIWPKIILGSRI